MRKYDRTIRSSGVPANSKPHNNYLSPFTIPLQDKIVFWLDIYFFEKVKAFLGDIFNRAVGEGENIN